MTIKELIQKLQKFDQESEIFFENDDNYYGKSNEKITDIFENTKDSFELFNEGELKRYMHLSRTSDINTNYTKEEYRVDLGFIDKEKRMNEAIEEIDQDIMLSDYAKKIQKDEIYKRYNYEKIQKDKAKWNKQETELNALKKKIVKKKIIVLK